MLTRTDIDKGIARNVMIYDYSANVSTVTTTFINLLFKAGLRNNFVIRTIYLPPDINFDIKYENCGYPFVLQQDLSLDNFTGSLYRYYIEDTKSYLPFEKSLLVIGKSKDGDILLGAI